MPAPEPAWAKYWDELWTLLTPLHGAGWVMPEDDDTSSEEDQGKHWTLYQRLMRTCMVFEVTYEPYRRRLTFGPGADELLCDDEEGPGQENVKVCDLGVKS